MSTPSDYAVNHWSAATATQLRDAARCPACRGPLGDGRCSRCGADLRGDTGAEIWRAAEAAADALLTFRSLIAQLDRPASVPVPAPASAAERAAITPPPRATAAPPPAAVRDAGSSTTLQSVLAVAGAGLVGLATLVFSFFNPDVTDPILRGLVMFVAAVLFFGGAPVLSRHGLRVSAESVGVLALASLALGTAIMIPVAPALLPAEATATLLALIGGAATLVLGVGTRIRAWMLTGALSLIAVPLLASVAASAGLLPLWGPLGSAAAALLLLEGGQRLARQRSARWMLERTVIVIAQLASFLALGVVALQGLGMETDPWLPVSLAVLGAGAVTARTARFAPRRLWSFVAGASVPVALVFASLALEDDGRSAVTSVLLLVPAASAIGVLALVGLSSARGASSRRWVVAGGATVAVLSLLPGLALAGMSVAGIIVAGAGAVGLSGTEGIAVVLSLVVAAVALDALTRIASARAHRSVPRARALRPAALWMLVLAGVAALGLDAANPDARAAVGFALTALSAAVIGIRTTRQRIPLALRAPIVAAGLVAVVSCVSLSWQTAELAVALGPAALLALAALGRSLPIAGRVVALAAGSSYALVLVATALQLVDVSAPAVVSLTATAGLAVAFVATFVRRLPARYWITILCVTVIPFLLAVGLIVVERSGWVAISTSTMVALAIALLLTTRPGLGLALRSLAGAIVVPSLAVVIVSLTAEFLSTSGSPVALPLIAVVCAIVVATLGPLSGLLRRRGRSAQHATAIVVAIEGATLLTGGFTIVLAYAREAAGLPTALLVLLILAAGAAGAAVVRHRPAYWWVAGMLASGALWTELIARGVTVPEAYALPPTLGAATVAVVLIARGRPHVPLFAAALGIAVTAMLAVLAFDPEPSPLRALSLLVASVVLLIVGHRRITVDGVVNRVLAAVRAPTLAVALTASMAGAIQAARWGLGVDAMTLALPLPLAVLGGAVVSGGLAGAAGLALHRLEPTLIGRRWALVPAITIVSMASWTAIDTTTLAVAVVYGVMWALLVALVAGALMPASFVPPVVPLFLLALVTAIVAWSPRELLRVEAFSLPLGLALLLAGAIALRRERIDGGSASGALLDWPAGRSGSWALLAPGLVVLVLASMLATATDPQTWRAVLVMAIALTAIVVGVRWRLAAPFVLGIIILPIENVLAFSVQIGRGIEAMPWWITLLIVGIVLLVIAVGSEQREGEGGRTAVRLRDLR